MFILRQLTPLRPALKWGLLFFLFHSLIYMVLVNTEFLTGVDPLNYLTGVILLLEFWWLLPLLLVAIPLTAVVNLKTLFFYSLWQDYQVVVLLLVGSLFYAVIGFCVGVALRSEPE